MRLRRYEFRIGRWVITWWDLWKKRPAFEIVRLDAVGNTKMVLVSIPKEAWR